MRPDEDGFVPFDGSAAGGDPELAALTDRLAQAGARARSAEHAPAADFAADLRARLVGPAGASAGANHGRCRHPGPQLDLGRPADR